jgi:hypothetical protein
MPSVLEVAPMLAREQACKSLRAAGRCRLERAHAKARHAGVGVEATLEYLVRHGPVLLVRQAQRQAVRGPGGPQGGPLGTGA